MAGPGAEARRWAGSVENESIGGGVWDFRELLHIGSMDTGRMA